MSLPKLHKPILITLVLLSTLPFFWLLTNVDFSLFSSDINNFWSSLALSLGNILGFIGAILMVWEFLLGVRYLSSLWSDDVIWINKFHGWIGKYGLLLVFVHPLLEMYVYLENWIWLFIPNLTNNSETHITFGRIAFILFIIIYFSSAILRSKLKYRPWLYIHYLSYPIMFLTFLHALDIGTYLNQYVALKAVWFTLMALYFVLIIYRLWMWSALSKPKFEISGTLKQSKDLLFLALKPKNKILIPKVGQYFYLQIKGFGESHPFSMMEFDEKTGTLIFGIKAIGSFTNKLASLKIGDEIFVDGPYGVFTQEAQNNLPKVIIAGGIGITPFVELVKKFKSPTTIFINANRTSDDIIAKNILQKELGNRYIDFLSQDPEHKGPQIVNSRINAQYLDYFLGGAQNINKYNYFICGSPNFIEGIKNSLKDLKINQNQIYAEEFSM